MGGYNLWDSASAPAPNASGGLWLQRLQLPPSLPKKAAFFCPSSAPSLWLFPPTFQPASPLSH